jgi:hypothetical protein
MLVDRISPLWKAITVADIFYGDQKEMTRGLAASLPFKSIPRSANPACRLPRGQKCAALYPLPVAATGPLLILRRPDQSQPKVVARIGWAQHLDDPPTSDEVNDRLPQGELPPAIAHRHSCTSCD